MEHKSAASASFLAPPILQEQAGGIYAYDVSFLSPGGPIMGSMMPAGAFDDIRPALIHPDVTSNAAWIGGVESSYMDKSRQKVFAVTWDRNQTVMYNTDLVKTMPTTIKEMGDSQWKGKLAFLEYQTGFTYNVAVAMNYHMKDQAAEWIKKIFVDQEPTYLRDGRQATEGLIRGEFAFATGPTLPILEQFAAEGLGKNVAVLDVPEMKTINMYGVLLYTKAPHPNAAKLFINWLLGRDGGLAVGEHLKFNSRRLDVPRRIQAYTRARTLRRSSASICLTILKSPFPSNSRRLTSSRRFSACRYKGDEILDLVGSRHEPCLDREDLCDQSSSPRQCLQACRASEHDIYQGS